MAATDLADPGDTLTTRGWWRWLGIALLTVLALLVLAVPAGLWWLSETPGGRAFVAAQVSGVNTESGMRFKVGRIDGSLFSRFDLVDVVVHDLDGPLAVIPVAHVSWRPLPIIRNLVDLDSIAIPELRMLRMWKLNPRNPDEPILPDIDIHIGRFDIASLILEKPLLGRAETIRTSGRVDIRKGRALVDMEAEAHAGDRLLLVLDAEPDNNRFDLRADLKGPAGGMVATAAGIDGPVTLDLDGKGGWSAWRGHLNADVGAGDSHVRVATLAIDMESGHLRVKGNVNPSPFVAAGAAELLKPDVQLDVSAFTVDNIVDLKLLASSAAISVAGGGKVDIKKNLFDGVQLTAVVKQPSALNPKLSGDGVQATLSADGSIFRDPLHWTLSARSLRFAGDSGPVGAEGLAASGQLLLQTDKRPLTITFEMKAGRIVGLPPETTAMLVDPRLSGTVVLADGTARIDNARLLTNTLDVKGSGQMRPDGHATASLDAGITRLDVPQVGQITGRATMQAAIAPGRPPEISGSFDGRALTLANASAAEFLGGYPAVRGKFSVGGNGVVAVSAVHFTSPNLQFADAAGSYTPASGHFTLKAAGSSRQYGPISLVASGTSTAPTATLRLPKPDFGFGITNLVAEIDPAAGGGIRIRATGDSPEGGVDARVIVLFGERRPLSLDIQHAAFAGITARGKLVQTAQGPFQGQLLIGGRGLTAKADLANQGGEQRADVVASAVNARLPLEPPVTIGKGAARFTVVMTPGMPQIKGSFRATGVVRDGLLLTEVEGVANLAGTSGQAVITAKGKSGDGEPFAATSRIQSVGTGYALTLDGTVGKLPLRLEQPARIDRVGGGWELKATRLVLPKGQIDMAGSFGGRNSHLRLVLRDVDLSIIDFLSADAGVDGVVNGQVDLRSSEASRIPNGSIDLAIKGLSREGVTGLTVPTDVRITGNSDGERLLLGARMTYRDHELGRLVLRVDPGAGETAADRFMAGRLSGGIRFNGPVAPLWAMVQMEGQELQGSLAIGADFTGTPADPVINGIVRGQNLVYRNAMLGTELTGMQLDGSFTGSTFIINSFTGKAHNGTLSGSGYVRLDEKADPQVDFKLELSKAKLANSDMIDITMSGPLVLKGRMNAATLSGNLVIDNARIQIVQLENSEIPQLKVRRYGETVLPSAAPSLSASNLKLDLKVRADDNIRVEGMGLDSNWEADVRVQGTASAPLILGSATLRRGEFVFASSDFNITRGRVVFNGRPLESAIDIQAQTQAADVLAVVSIGGTAGRPEVRFSSTPTLPEDEILSRLLFGTSVADLSVTEAVQLATAVAGLQSGVDTMGKVRRSVGLDRLRLVGDNAASGMGTGIALGKRLTRNVYVEVITDSRGNTMTSLQLTLSRIWSLFVEASSQGKTSVNLRHHREY